MDWQGKRYKTVPLCHYLEAGLPHHGLQESSLGSGFVPRPHRTTSLSLASSELKTAICGGVPKLANPTKLHEHFSPVSVSPRAFHVLEILVHVANGLTCIHGTFGLGRRRVLWRIKPSRRAGLLESGNRVEGPVLTSEARTSALVHYPPPFGMAAQVFGMSLDRITVCGAIVPNRRFNLGYMGHEQENIAQHLIV
jgi:hypothetical protein